MQVGTRYKLLKPLRRELHEPGLPSCDKELPVGLIVICLGQADANRDRVLVQGGTSQESRDFAQAHLAAHMHVGELCQAYFQEVR